MGLSVLSRPRAPAVLSRHDITDAHWGRIQDLLPGRPGGHGGVGHDNRLVLNAVRYLAEAGIAWADLPCSSPMANPTACGGGTTGGARKVSGTGSRPHCGTTTPSG